MMNKKKLDAHAFIEIVNEQFSLGQGVIFTVTGNSMYPFLRDRKDAVRLEKINKDLKKGNIVLFRYQDKLILHRIIKIRNNEYTLCGDYSSHYEKCSYEDIYGVVTKIYKNSKEVDVTKPIYCMKVKIWMILRPFRFVIRKIFRPKG